MNGPGSHSQPDATYDYGFQRLQGQLPANTFGGFPADYYSTAYNAGYGSWGLASSHHRDQGILSYEFMIENDQSGPYSWWESSTAPSTTTPWIGSHPSAGQGSSPHAWGMSEANKVLLDSLVAEKSDGTMIVGRGVPAAWLRAGQSMAVKNFPTTDGKRVGLRITSKGRSVTLTMSGGRPGRVLFQLPSFVDNISHTSAGKIDRQTGTVSLAPGTMRVTVALDTPVRG